ncbi:MAG: nucleoside-diphosphate sugar epimerase/dehydratase [Burkholderiaceae bacterium]|uniref:polysaccharide biosynthesis protein n=1 Tax=Hydrogenophaga sp. TaxID=1904254 RepID=UPI00276544EF|nr:nucleoside-diphosphate sugar epimerase/dehydratase [Hydrogenophaga sp.]MDP2066108.1 nucleoside-diphosphate sugar epimerase/dehydratase [Burkholderiaceae bacterium]MDZ4398685.1 nucleoside-diphosphate sugar epimerase/dehydratase [Hydrogenophaga sp.]
MLSLLAVDSLLVLATWWLAFWLRFNLEIPDEFVELAWSSSPLPLLAYGAGLAGARVYRHVWRFTGMPELRQLALGVFLAGLLTAAGILMLRLPNFPRSVLLLHPLLALVALGGVRAVWRTFSERPVVGHASARPLLIVGSLQDASDALRALKGSHQWRPVGIVSPEPGELGRSLQGVPVLGGHDAVASVAKATGASTVLVASPPGSGARRDLLLLADDARFTLLTMPRPDEWLRSDGPGPRHVELEDLLGRTPIQLDVAGLSDLFAGQTVLVTGAGGSIGSELCRQIARFGVARLMCVDVSEIAVYELEQELRAAHPQMQAMYYTANVREFERLQAIATAHRPAVVFHAAAYKHVPLMEELNEIEAVRTNVLGTLHAARVAGLCGARRFVMISTDKAVNPTNVMGASKRLAELVVQAVAVEHAATQYVSVRFGNVLGSSGSVVPLFTRQIQRGGPVTVTHPDIVRYFMTIPEAAQLVLQAGLMGRSGQIYVLDMGEPVKIIELARLLIRLSGKTEQDVPIAFTGLRPGEKLFEELLADDETTEPTPHPKLRVAKTSGQSAVGIDAVAGWIARAGPAPASHDLRRWLQTHLPEYVSPNI